MQAYQQDFLKLALDHGALKFGEFTLKSGRISPYFFNLGAIASGTGLQRLSQCYANALLDSRLNFDCLFGPAYKGIPLVAATACALANQGRDVAFTYNRKEAKNHGEGGNLVGAPLTGDVIIIDDVITAGTAVREAIGLIEAAGARVRGLLVALDRQERGAADESAIQALESEYGLTTVPICRLADIIDYLAAQAKTSGETHPHDVQVLDAIRGYRDHYGI